MEISKSFDPKTIEQHWYPEWERRGYFRESGNPQVPAYCIQLPPPNVTGTLHMGHAFQQTLMDALVRYHRMLGCNTNWVMGTDHAGIATQIVVERQLQAEGTSRLDLGRDAFLSRVAEWKQQSGSTITRQMRRLGVSGNWTYADTEGQAAGYFTMDSKMSSAVAEVFVRLHDEGLIYRGKRLVNWDPVLGTAVSDLEVDTEEEDGTIWEIRYTCEGGEGGIVVATTRPETLLGDAAVAVHPDDGRYKALVGKQLVLPISGRLIPIIEDHYVDPAFGTGCVKITPGHDFNDHAVGARHNLPVWSILTLDARIIGEVVDEGNVGSESRGKQSRSHIDARQLQIPECYWGLDRFEARKKILEELRTKGLLVSEKPYKLRVPRSGRTGAIVEPLLTDQWFVRTEGLAKRALKVVADGQIRFYPEHWVTTYNHWLENIQDWCVSRQLWWGHQIPAWFDGKGNYYVARSEEEAEALAAAKGYTGALTRDADVLDTWFSSALVPFTSLGWPERTKDLDQFLPSSVLVTGFDIIFFWVARMIMMTLHFTDKVPFHHIYINALVRDADGEKMSKSKGNTLDPIDLIDGSTADALLKKSAIGLLKDEHRQKVEHYILRNFPAGIPAFGTDALRFTFASLATFSRTLNFDLSRCEGYRNFCNKLWNASRYVLMNTESQDCGLDESATAERSIADRWIISMLQRTELEVQKGFEDYRFDHVASAIYRFVWEEYCDWYVEFAKVQLATGTPSQLRGTRKTLVRVLETVLRLAHPIIPFITEELWQRIAPLAGKHGESIMLAAFPMHDASRIDLEAESRINVLKELVGACRNLRSELKLAPSERVPLEAMGDARTLMEAFPYLRSLAKVSAAEVVDTLSESGAPVAISGEFKLMLKLRIDIDAERGRLQKETSRLDAEIARAQAKLSNDNFRKRAPPEIVALEEERLQVFRTTAENLRLQLRQLAAR